MLKYLRAAILIISEYNHVWELLGEQFRTNLYFFLFMLDEFGENDVAMDFAGYDAVLL